MVMTNPSVEEIIKRLVMANHDGEIKAMAVVFINAENEPEMELAFGGNHVYQLCTSLDIIKYNILKMMMDNAAKKPKDRE